LELTRTHTHTRKYTHTHTLDKEMACGSKIVGGEILELKTSGAKGQYVIEVPSCLCLRCLHVYRIVSCQVLEVSLYPITHLRVCVPVYIRVFVCMTKTSEDSEANADVLIDTKTDVLICTKTDVLIDTSVNLALFECHLTCTCHTRPSNHMHKLTHTRAHAHSRTQKHLQTLSHTQTHTQTPARAPTPTSTQTPTRTPTQRPTRRRTEYTIPLHPICVHSTNTYRQ